jgi:regulator of RNase E activity RraA
MQKALPIILIVFALVLAGVVGYVAYTTGFESGRTQAQNIRAEFVSTRTPQGSGSAGSAGDQGGAAFRGGNIAGAALTVKSMQGNTIQATRQDGTTVTITVDAQTVYQKTTNGALTDIQPGARVIVVGAGGSGTSSSSANPTSLTARTIQIQPQ